jgi:hypothetical protein
MIENILKYLSDKCVIKLKKKKKKKKKKLVFCQQRPTAPQNVWLVGDGE